VDVSDAVTTDYVEHDVKTPVSKLRGTFDDQNHRVVVITNGGEFEGVVAQTQLLSSHHPPDETAMNVLQHPPKVQRTENVREVARLMVENELRLLPIFENREFVGVVTAESVLRMVEDNLNVLDVGDVSTRDLIAVEPGASLGQVINRLREHKITRVPVVAEDGDLEGLVSVYDVVDFVVRQVDREQSGAPAGFDEHGGEGSYDGYRSNRGFGERAGEETRLLDLPVRDVMSTPVMTTKTEEQLDRAVDRMLDADVSSLVVVDDDGRAEGIVTKTDALRALTWDEEEQLPVQIFNVELLDDLTRKEIAETIESIDAKYADMDVLEANVVLHRHEEKLRGKPFMMVTIRLFTDVGRFIGTGEEYGAAPAFDDAAEILEENVLEQKSREMALHNRKDSPEKRQEIEHLLGWWLETA
jgi:CBS domain-containing protein